MELPPLPSSWKLIAFTINLLCGLLISQIAGAVMDESAYDVFSAVVQVFVMWALSFIMTNVGYEFTIDTNDLAEYGWDYLIAMTAAGFPWLFCALWFYATIDGMDRIDECLLVARFAAPTSAGILFSMLEAAGLRETWVFQKARILAIFDDLDTIILMIPLKILMIGFKWELMVVIAIMFGLLALAWIKLHKIALPHTWPWTLLYAAIVSGVCKLVHHVTHHNLHMDEPIHIEVLLPAFVVGCIIDTPCAREELALQRKNSIQRKLTRQLTRDAKALSKTMSEGDRIFMTSPKADGLMASQHKEGPAQDSDVSTQTGGSLETEASVIQVSDVSDVPGDKDTAQAKVSVVAPVSDENFPPGCIGNEGGTKNACEAQESKLLQQLGDQPPRPTLLDPMNNYERTFSKPSWTSNKDNGTVKPGDPVTDPLSYVGGRTDSKGEGVRAGAPRSISKISNRSVASHQSQMSKVSKLSRHGHQDVHSDWEHNVQTVVSIVFMVLVGLSMPALFGSGSKSDEDSEEDSMSPGLVVLHIIIVTLLMILGKMYPSVCYRDEASWNSRVALCLGMCPRGEVGASIIVISLELGIEGPAIVICMCALVINLVMSGGFIAGVKLLLRDTSVTEPAASSCPSHVVAVSINQKEQKDKDTMLEVS